MYVMEPLIDGAPFSKFNSNRHDGRGFEQEERIEEDDDTQIKEQKALVLAAQGLSCWSWKYTNEAALLCDVQGSGTFLSDPAWVTRHAHAHAPTPYGGSNVGGLTIKTFFRQHDHDNNPICQALNTIVPPQESLVFANIVLTVYHKKSAVKTSLRQKIVQSGGTLCYTTAHSRVRFCF